MRANGVAGGKPQRFCCDRCADDSYNARKRGSRRRPAERLATFPKVFGMPPAPFFARGSCTQPEYRSTYWWTSDKPAERARAIEVCLGCPVLSQCAEWSMSITFADTTAIYGAMSAIERRRAQTARRRAAEPVSAPPAGDGMPGAA